MSELCNEYSKGILEDSARYFPTILRFVCRVFLNQRSVDYSVASDPIAVDWVAGIFMAFRRETYSSIDGFDERYFMYLEDADLCQRIRKVGLKVILDPRMYIIHDAQRASRNNWQHRRWHYRSAVRFLFGI